MFTRLLVGLDGSPVADVALEQAVMPGEHFQSTIVVAHARGGACAGLGAHGRGC